MIAMGAEGIALQEPTMQAEGIAALITHLYVSER